MKTISMYALENIPLIKEGDDLGEIIYETVLQEKFQFEDGDIVVVTSKIVSKAEGRLVDTTKVKPSEKTVTLAKDLDMDPKALEVILGETKKVLIARPDLLLTEHLLGFICTKAGVDSSNTVAGPKGEILSLLPEDPDASASKIRQIIERSTGKKISLIINDTFGRPDRKGSVGMSIGISGIGAVYTPPDTQDIDGKTRRPQIALIDELSAAASIIMGQTNERRPVAIIRGVDYQVSETAKLKDLLHPTTKFIQDVVDTLSQAKKDGK